MPGPTPTNFTGTQHGPMQHDTATDFELLQRARLRPLALRLIDEAKMATTAGHLQTMSAAELETVIESGERILAARRKQVEA
jgi:hypothetical protein